MPVFFGRDVSKFADFISVWYGSSPVLRQPSNVSPSYISSTQTYFADARLDEVQDSVFPRLPSHFQHGAIFAYRQFRHGLRVRFGNYKDHHLLSRSVEARVPRWKR